jgi:uncharacterized repeat protein (TIGR01451 family)
MREPDFYLSADMRLLELQRSALGIEAPDRADWENRAIAEGQNIPDDPIAAPSGAVLNIVAVATPSEGVIPGAIVTLSLSVANEGVAPARNVHVIVPLPGGASYRPGSFARDGAPAFDEIAERLFGAGLDLGDLAPKSRATFVWKIGVRLGMRPLVVAPQIRAADAAVIGASALSISRKELPAGAARAAASPPDPIAPPIIPVDVSVPDIPFYELDEEEQSAYAEPSTPAPSAKPPVAAPPPATPPAAPVAPPEPRTREAIALLGTFDRPTLSFFDRTFRGAKPPTVLQHCIFGSALACTQPYGRRDDTVGLRAHFDAQSQILHRIALHEKLGKKEPIADYAGELLARIGEFAPEPLLSPAIVSDSVRVVLETEISEPSLAVLRSLEAESARWDFVKARQLTLALQAQRVVGGTASEPQRAAVENALRAYGQAAVTTLQRLFVRIRIDRTTGVLGQTDAELDRRAVALLDALAPLFP